jgi:hypothetical protein
MRHLTFAVGLLAAALFLFHPASAADASKKFFNGKDLDGWEGLKEFWSVEGGAIVGRCPAELKFNTFLCSKRKYRDFELRFKVRLKDGKGNSGVQIRSKIFDGKHFAVQGPQCDIGQGYWGSLYGEHKPDRMMKQAPADVVRRVLKPAGFNDYHIKCVGDHVTIKLNGATTVDDDFPDMPKDGIIAWQIHGNMGAMEVTFKDIVFKALGGK